MSTPFAKKRRGFLPLLNRAVDIHRRAVAAQVDGLAVIQLAQLRELCARIHLIIEIVAVNLFILPTFRESVVADVPIVLHVLSFLSVVGFSIPFRRYQYTTL